MFQVDIISMENKPVGKVELPNDIFGVAVKKGILHEVVRNYLANQRQGTAVTKTRGKVSGGGRKPYRQKGTGRARAGSNRSPLWKGGGTVFGPVKRDYSYKLPKKVKWTALGAALSSKFSDGEILVVKDFSLEKPKTRELVTLLKGLGLKNVLIILPAEDETIKRAARNVPNVKIGVVGKLNVYEILFHEKLLFTQKAVEKMKEVYL
ncbi:MAG: 50S ribosomal protein L4 [Thermodesulfovibrionia bacterium]|nr:50S ribosomal protein L4 [Thermodesulfovibrionia bacterium]MCK5512020.1 50S ribosomal protein L4 [Thermodesulfovibrionia bacterium]